MTKKAAYQDRQVVHELNVGEFENVTVYRNLDDGEIRVSYDSFSNMEEAPVDLVFKPGEIVEGKGGKMLKTPDEFKACLLYTSPSPRDATLSRMPSSA